MVDVQYECGRPLQYGRTCGRERACSWFRGLWALPRHPPLPHRGSQVRDSGSLPSSPSPYLYHRRQVVHPAAQLLVRRPCDVVRLQYGGEGVQPGEPRAACERYHDGARRCTGWRGWICTHASSDSGRGTVIHKPAFSTGQYQVRWPSARLTGGPVTSSLRGILTLPVRSGAYTDSTAAFTHTRLP